MVFESF